ncbi:MAG: RNA polymerase sigma factor [Acidobacteriota bacterium]
MTADQQQTDPELLTQALAGREDRFAELYGRRQGGVFRFALQMSGSVAVAEDVTQETFLALLTHGTRFDPARGSVAAFLYGIARNVVLRRLEHERRFEQEEDSCADGDVLDDLTRSQSIERVREAVLCLPPVYREVIVLCDLQETSYEEAATALACPIGTVRSRLNRGRAMLAQKLCITLSVSPCRERQTVRSLE